MCERRRDRRLARGGGAPHWSSSVFRRPRARRAVQKRSASTTGRRSLARIKPRSKPSSLSTSARRRSPRSASSRARSRSSSMKTRVVSERAWSSWIATGTLPRASSLLPRAIRRCAPSRSSPRSPRAPKRSEMLRLHAKHRPRAHLRLSRIVLTALKSKTSQPNPNQLRLEPRARNLAPPSAKPSSSARFPAVPRSRRVWDQGRHSESSLEDASAWMEKSAVRSPSARVRTIPSGESSRPPTSACAS